ncbi:hypothetical protein [Leptolyngbya sp. KIOST-1]|uniref:hypothetical protein n=1 Tax=Leptolyngbya sp. KIOST-1 TaxID=1229172 RepID=UPI000560A41C|nr:hypothetical protein [Leptolyngbya sp. KIOST-1]
MNPRKIGLAMGQGAQVVVNLMAVVMVLSGIYMIFTGDEDESLLGAANTLLGATLFTLPEPTEAENSSEDATEPDENQ